MSAAPDSRDVFEILDSGNHGRIPELIPIRYGRMIRSPFSFFRGAAAVMAYDLARTPNTGIAVQLCGDAHLSNFGLFATPERRLVFSVNDFDETLPGPWEWDLKRLVTSVIVAGIENGLSDTDCQRAALATAREYRLRMRTFAGMRLLDIWYHTVDFKALIRVAARARGDVTQRAVVRARQRDHLRALARLTEVVDGQHRIRHVPPLLLRVDDQQEVQAQVDDVLQGYISSLPEERRPLFSRYRLIDVAMKVVGVGSVGTHCWIGLLHREGVDGAADPIFLQVKEASPSVLEEYLGPSEYPHPGQRVVIGQRLMQAFPDLFLGWTDAPLTGRQYYVRQLHDMKGSVDVDRLGPTQLALYGSTCGWTLARAHARGGEAAIISGYLGKAETFDRAIVAFAQQYARQNIEDYEAFVAACRDREIPLALDA